MREKIRQFMEEKGVGKWFKRDNLIVMVLAGILLLIIALPSGKSERRAPDGGTGEKQQREADTQGTAEMAAEKAAEKTAGKKEAAVTQEREDAGIENYEKTLEEKLKKILGSMNGAGKVEVMITFYASEELVVEKDRPMTRSNTSENDGEGGTRTIYQTDSGESSVYRSEGANSEPYVVKTLMPKVEGVLVAAQGAGNGEVTRHITEAVQALFDLEAHKIKVIRMK